MKNTSCATLVIALFMSGCTLLQTHPTKQACELVEVAMDEGEFAEAWYDKAGEVLQACGIAGAKKQAQRKACYARKFSNNAEICE